MIDFITVCYINYDLILLQIENFKKNIESKDKIRLIIVDNTPNSKKNSVLIEQIKNESIVTQFIETDNPMEFFDGVSHGKSLDLAINYSDSNIVCIFDSDFFIIKKDIIEYVLKLFDEGYHSVGCEFNDGTMTTINLMNKFPNLFKNSPIIFCAFYDKNIVKNNSFIIQQEEINWNTSYIEVGYKLREYINNNNLKGHLWRGDIDKRPTMFYDLNKPIGVHLCRGSFMDRNNVLKNLENIITI